MEIPSRVILGDYKEKELLKDAYSFCYQETDKLSLNLHLFAPQGHTPESQTPIVVFFHGGLWDTSMPTQLASQAIHFSQRGLVSCLVEYRVSNVHGTDMTAAQEDISEAMNYLRLNASGFGLNPEQFILCGAAGGGMLVLNEVLTNESTANSCKGIHLLGPISDLSTREHLEQFSLDKKSAKELSPLKLLPKKELPDCLILHGKSDRLVNSDQSIKLSKAYRKKGNTCEHSEFEGADHRFFNYNTNPRLYEVSLNMMDDFLVERGLLSPDPLRGI